MDPVLKTWMFYHWLEDQKEKIDITKNHAYLVGSFINPEAVKDMLQDGNKIESSDEDFEKSWQMVQGENVIDDTSQLNTVKRKRRTIRA